MVLNRKWFLGLMASLALLILSACSEDAAKSEPTNSEAIDHSTEADHGEEMNHSSSGEVPSTLKTAENPKFPVGSTAMIKDGHMSGMKGAEATIVGAYDTTAYIISYEPTTGGKKIENHKWVIHEELIDPGAAPLAPGTEVKTTATHMKGMENATVRIDEAVQTTVYMIDFPLTTTGEEMKNHKWVTDSELTSK
ncbi:YdhK family protein [Lysinibacillus sp. NPDC093712]|uniref:YdhK family protein n=1 Tax=Lysinibacillus sp. NPDC093712 TaxID=3390579 RepID=UPI003D05AD50